MVGGSAMILTRWAVLFLGMLNMRGRHIMEVRERPQYRPQNTIALIMGIPKKVPLILGNPQVVNPDDSNPPNKIARGGPNMHPSDSRPPGHKTQNFTKP